MLVCGFDDTTSCRIAFVPHRMNRNRRGTRWTICWSVSMLTTWQLTESARIMPSTLTWRSDHLKTFASGTLGSPGNFRLRAVFTESAALRTPAPYFSHADDDCGSAGSRGAVICTSVRVAVVAAASSRRTLIRSSRICAASSHCTAPVLRFGVQVSAGMRHVCRWPSGRTPRCRSIPRCWTGRACARTVHLATAPFAATTTR